MELQAADEKINNSNVLNEFSEETLVVTENKVPILNSQVQKGSSDIDAIHEDIIEQRRVSKKMCP